MKTIYKTIAIGFIATVAASALYITYAANHENQSKESDKVISLTTEEFCTNVYDIYAEELEFLGDKPAIIDFNATWCGPCRRIAPILDELANEYEDEIVIYAVDVDECGELAAAFGISSIPAILYIPLEGEPVMTVGMRNKEKFIDEINEYLLK